MRSSIHKSSILKQNFRYKIFEAIQETCKTKTNSYLVNYCGLSADNVGLETRLKYQLDKCKILSKKDSVKLTLIERDVDVFKKLYKKAKLASLGATILNKDIADYANTHLMSETTHNAVWLDYCSQFTMSMLPTIQLFLNNLAERDNQKTGKMFAITLTNGRERPEETKYLKKLMKNEPKTNKEDLKAKALFKMLRVNMPNSLLKTLKAAHVYKYNTVVRPGQVGGTSAPMIMLLLKFNKGTGVSLKNVNSYLKQYIKAYARKGPFIKYSVCLPDGKGGQIRKKNIYGYTAALGWARSQFNKCLDNKDIKLNLNNTIDFKIEKWQGEGDTARIIVPKHLRIEDN